MEAGLTMRGTFDATSLKQNTVNAYKEVVHRYILHLMGQGSTGNIKDGAFREAVWFMCFLLGRPLAKGDPWPDGWRWPDVMAGTPEP